MSANLAVASASVAIPAVELSWLVRLVNGYAQPAREASGEDSSPYPDVMKDPGAPALSRVAQRDLVSAAQRLWPVFAGLTKAERTARLNDMLDESDLSPRVNKDGELRWTTSFTGSGPLLLAVCTAALLSATQQHGWRRMGIWMSTLTKPAGAPADTARPPASTAAGSGPTAPGSAAARCHDPGGVS